MGLYRIILILVVFSLGNKAAVAQPQLWDVYSISDQPFANVTIDGYRSDSLYAKSMNQLIAFHQDSIRYLVKRNSSKFALGLLVGAVVGGIIAGASSTGSDAFSDLGRASSVTLGIVVGGVLGGAIGSAAGADTRYRIEKLDADQKRRLLSRLFPSR